MLLKLTIFIYQRSGSIPWTQFSSISNVPYNVFSKQSIFIVVYYKSVLEKWTRLIGSTFVKMFSYRKWWMSNMGNRQIRSCLICFQSGYNLPRTTQFKYSSKQSSFPITQNENCWMKCCNDYCDYCFLASLYIEKVKFFIRMIYYLKKWKIHIFYS